MRFRAKTEHQVGRVNTATIVFLYFAVITVVILGSHCPLQHFL